MSLTYCYPIVQVSFYKEEHTGKMDTNLDMQNYMSPDQSLRVSPTLIMVNSLLAASSLELQQMVQAELEQNPALESVESVLCMRCGAGVTGRYCPVCAQPV